MLRVDLQAHPPLANALRRTVLSHVECPAVGSLTIHMNRTPFWDEYVAHRMGLLVLRDGDSDVLTLNVNNDETQVRLVTADELTPPAAVHGNTPIVYLPPGGSLHVDCHVRTGTGAEHARFTPGHAYVKGCTLYIESFGGMAPEKILHTAVATLRRILANAKDSASFA